MGIPEYLRLVGNRKILPKYYQTVEAVASYGMYEIIGKYYLDIGLL